MSAPTIQQEMQECFAELNEAEQKHVLKIAKDFLAEHHSQPISIEQYNKEIDEALADVAKGNYITHEDLIKESAEWHK